MLYEEMSKKKYLFYILLHPQVGFEEMKFNKKGSVLYANLVLFLFFFANLFSKASSGYLFRNVQVQEINIFWILAGSVGLLVLWCVSNWLFCTLMDGKGHFHEIWIASCYALLPYSVVNICMTCFTNILTNEERVFFNAIIFLATVWSAIILYTAVMVMHDFTMGKTLATILLTVIGMLIIIFLLILLFTLVDNIYDFITVIYNELKFL